MALYIWCLDCTPAITFGEDDFGGVQYNADPNRTALFPYVNDKKIPYLNYSERYLIALFDEDFDLERYEFIGRNSFYPQLVEVKGNPLIIVENEFVRFEIVVEYNTIVKN